MIPFCPAGAPGCDEDLTDPGVAKKVLQMIPKGIAEFSAVKYLKQVLKEIAG